MCPLSSHPPLRARGWTLVESMLALGVMATLAAIAMPLYTDYRDAMRASHSAKEIGVMSAAIEHYWQDHRAYPDTLADVGFGGRNDPWGRGYRFYNIDRNGRGGARKDKALNPINTDFDLYSVGADGKTKGQISNRDSEDDVIRANNGRFIGLARQF